MKYLVLVLLAVVCATMWIAVFFMHIEREEPPIPSVAPEQRISATEVRINPPIPDATASISGINSEMDTDSDYRPSSDDTDRRDVSYTGHSVDALAVRLGRGERDDTLDAARELADIGSEPAVRALLEYAQGVTDRNELGDMISIIRQVNSPATRHVLWDVITGRYDSPALRGMAQDILAQELTVHDAAQIQNRHYAAADPRAQAGVEALVVTMHDASHLPLLSELAGPKWTPPDNSLAVAALQGLALIGTPEAVSELLDRVRASGPQLHDELRHAFGFIDNPASYEMLLEIAGGYAPDITKSLQLAAIEGLGGYPDEYKVNALNHLLGLEHDEDILQAIFLTLGGDIEAEDD